MKCPDKLSGKWKIETEEEMLAYFGTEAHGDLLKDLIKKTFGGFSQAEIMEILSEEYGRVITDEDFGELDTEETIQELKRLYPERFV